MTSSPQDFEPSASVSRREEILAVAAELFWANGYDATTMAAIAMEMGFQKASLYHHVDKKETLLYELSLKSLARITETTEAALAAATEPRMRLRRLIESHVSTALEERSKHATMLTELRALTAKEYETISKMRDAYDSIVETTIRDGQEAGVLRTDISAKLLRLALLGMLNWTIFWFRPDGKASPVELAQMFASIFIEGGQGES